MFSCVLMPKVVIMKKLRDLGHVCMTFCLCFGEWNTKHRVYTADLTTDERKKHARYQTV